MVRLSQGGRGDHSDELADAAGEAGRNRTGRSVASALQPWQPAAHDRPPARRAQITGRVVRALEVIVGCVGPIDRRIELSMVEQGGWLLYPGLVGRCSAVSRSC